MKESSQQLYNRAFNKLGLTDLTDPELVVNRINQLPSTSYKTMAYLAIFKRFKDIPDLIYQEYKKLKNNEHDNVGTLPMTLEALLSIKVDCTESLRQLVESMTIYINTHYPLRLDYYNVKINPSIEETNYMIYENNILTFYLNDFKNVKSFGPQVIVYDDDVIRDYITGLTDHFGYLPEYFLYRYSSGKLVPFSSRIMYGGYLQDILRKYTGLHITMNDIRKIHESALIQSPEYSKMTNMEKKKRHERLLHRTATAHSSYNIIEV